MAKDQGQPFTPRTRGERIAHARRQLGVREGRDIQPPEIAERIGVTGASVYNWEKGVVPSEENLIKLAALLGVTRSWILFDDPPTTSKPEQVPAEQVESLRAAKRSAARGPARQDDDPPARKAAGGRRHPKNRPGGR